MLRVSVWVCNKGCRVNISSRRLNGVCSTPFLYVKLRAVPCKGVSRVVSPFAVMNSLCRVSADLMLPLVGYRGCRVLLQHVVFGDLEAVEYYSSLK
jgi:hypothetical protein